MKKILSFALALVMLLGIMPAIVPTADAANYNATVDGNIYVQRGAPTVDGIIGANEYGAADYVARYSTATGPSAIEYWFRYEGSYFYVTVRIHDTSIAQGTIFNESSFLSLRPDKTMEGTLNSSDYVGLICKLANGSIYNVDPGLGNPNNKIGVAYGTNSAVFEIGLHKDVLGSISIAENIRFIGRVEYQDYDAATKSHSSYNNDFTFVLLRPGTFVQDGGDVVINKGTPTVDGTIGANEWGKPVYTANFSANGGPSKVEYYLRYDYDYVYAAAKVYDDTYAMYGGASTASDSWKKSNYYIPRFNTLDVGKGTLDNLGDNYPGLCALLGDGSVFSDIGASKLKAISYSNGVGVFEYALNKTMAEGDTITLRMEYADLGTGSQVQYFADLDCTVGSLVPYTENGADIVADGNITADEWGTPDFDMNRAFTVNEANNNRRYVKNQYANGPHPTAEFYWRYDDDNLYVAIAYDYGGAGSAGYEAWNYEDVYDPNTFKCNLSLRYKSHTSNVNLAMGNYSKVITVANYDEGKANNIDGATFAYNDNGGIAYYEIIIPMSKVTTGDSFQGYIELDDRVAAEQVVISGTPALYNGQQLFTNGVRVLNNCVMDIRTTAAYKSSSRTNDTFILEQLAAEEEEETFTPSATPDPNPTTPGLTPGLTPSKPTDTPIPAPSTPVTASSFTDVDEDDWYYEDLAYVVEAGLMNGVGGNKFAPGNDLDRSMLVTTLWRLAGEPTVNVNTFDDVAYDAWYTYAVNWAAEEGIVKGYAGLFNPTDGITREQVCAILHRYADMMGYKSSDFSNRYYKTSDWAAADVAWADANGILDIPTDMEDMTEVASRAEIAAMLARFCKAFVD